MSQLDNRGIRRHYHVIAVLGEGGFGKVYLVRDLSAGGIERYAALKVLRSDARVRDEQRFRDEATILSLLDHPSFVRVNALFRLDGRWAFDMEYVRGATLDRLLGYRGTLPVPVALEVVLQVAEALEMAWSHAGPNGKPLRVMHRDIKPSNLLLTRGGVVKVLDFGIARWEAAPREAETATRLPASVGYMAPERFGFSADFGPEADVYALGAVLWEMLTGEPWLVPGAVDTARKADLAVVERYSHGRLVRLDELGFPPAVSALVREMLQPDAATRPTAAQVAATIAGLASEVGRGGEARAWVRTELAPLLDRLPTGTEGDGWCGRDLSSDLLSSNTGDRNTAYRFLPLLAQNVEPKGTLIPSDQPRESWPPKTHTATARRVQLGAALALAVLLLGGMVWSYVRDGDGDGVPDRGDCAPDDPGRRPGAAERCDGADQDCDDEVDEGLAQFTLYVDGDGDGFGAGGALSGCQRERPGQVASATDCDDARADVHPGGAEVHSNGLDDDCDPATADTPPTKAGDSSRAPARPAYSTASTVSPPPAPAPTGEARVIGSSAAVTLTSGGKTYSLEADSRTQLPAGSYHATMKGELGSTAQDFSLTAGGTVTFDCKRPSMGVLCKVSVLP